MAWWIDLEKHPKEVVEKARPYFEEVGGLEFGQEEKPAFDYYLDHLLAVVREYLLKEYTQVQKFRNLKDIEVVFYTDCDDNGEPEGATVIVLFHLQGERGPYSLLLYREYWSLEDVNNAEESVRRLFVAVDNNLLVFPIQCWEGK